MLEREMIVFLATVALLVIVAVAIGFVLLLYFKRRRIQCRLAPSPRKVLCSRCNSNEILLTRLLKDIDHGNGCVTRHFHLYCKFMKTKLKKYCQLFTLERTYIFRSSNFRQAQVEKMMVEHPKFLDQLMPDSGGNSQSPHVVTCVLPLQGRRCRATASPAPSSRWAAPPATGTTAARSAAPAPAKHSADSSVFNLQQFDFIIYVIKVLYIHDMIQLCILAVCCAWKTG